MIKNPSYRIYETPNKVIAVSSFAGQTVRGVAKCNPADEFDPEKGTALAIARCDTKIAEKRMKRACSKVDEAKAIEVMKKDRLVICQVSEADRDKWLAIGRDGSEYFSKELISPEVYSEMIRYVDEYRKK